MSRFTGKTAIVTGGSRGIGRAAADRLVAEGAEVLIVGRTEGDLDRAVEEIAAAGGEGRIWSLRGDLAEAEFCAEIVATALERWSRVDVLVNNAGLVEEATFLDLELGRWDYVVDVLLRAPFLIAQAAARSMVEGGGGAIVHVASIDGRATDGPYVSYAVAKAGLIQLSRNIAVELGPRGVRSNTVSPGWALTSMVEGAATADELEMMRTAFERVPLRRLVSAEEVASTICYLASEEASGITGSDLVVDGGTTADLYIVQTFPAG